MKAKLEFKRPNYGADWRCRSKDTFNYRMWLCSLVDAVYRIPKSCTRMWVVVSDKPLHKDYVFYRVKLNKFYAGFDGEKPCILDRHNAVLPCNFRVWLREQIMLGAKYIWVEYEA